MRLLPANAGFGFKCNLKVNNMTVEWSVYDNKNDEVIGVWDNLAAAQSFLFENADVDDVWELFPMLECLTPVK